jgi:stage II sporulation protein GA (sporulation sigma-E factor processing peptidase)
LVVYMDVIWLLNLLVDSMLLWTTSIILKRRVALWRFFVGGFAGSVLIIMSITPLAVYAGYPIVKLGFSFVMILAVFGFKRLKYFVSNLLTFYFATFLMGGILIGTHYFLNFNLQLNSSMFLASIRGFGDPISWIFVILGLPIAWHFSKQRISSFEVAKIQYDQIAEVQIEINGLKCLLQGMIDSGNNLYDPLSKMPVMIVSTRKIEGMIPGELLKVAENSESIMNGTASLPAEWHERMRFIPAQSVGKKNQLLLAYKPDLIEIRTNQQCWTVKKALISFTNLQLSNDDQFQCIVHPKMLTGIPNSSAS